MQDAPTRLDDRLLIAGLQWLAESAAPNCPPRGAIFLESQTFSDLQSPSKTCRGALIVRKNRLITARFRRTLCGPDILRQIGDMHGRFSHGGECDESLIQPLLVRTRRHAEGNRLAMRSGKSHGDTSRRLFRLSFVLPVYETSELFGRTNEGETSCRP